ncbi:uncharacterized protein Z520_12147 [Fonsecaea multimorphosa CBS 102226]|uniref:Protein kinase domain-containing protein n=1 Tax=Fonsecaea multimorphosa CBS 102226 TaxID=1442371 RepID=A0A0D2JNT9_9EURO|nr:uncharacterized protein Z520_12147 [Fonsecaea multimorphosa CBS 102226]KIX92154.1 hypothetical protein Z520_12147 [Fonsecaea multimorphosa CBS 102226]OAL17521.1 hypothetical protein AYO22_11556 [Fonsecaea multimorphosa]
MADADKEGPETLPNTPDTVPLDDHFFSPRTRARLEGDFARLVPVNHAAVLAFHSIAERTRLEPDWNPHIRKFLFIEETPRQLSPEWDGSDASSDTTGGHPTQVLMGYYRLSLEILTNHTRLGWVIGSGRKDLVNGGVDFLLTLQKNRHHVHGRHARLVHHAQNGALMLVVGKGKVVLVNGIERLEGSQRVLGSVRTALSFGNLSYSLEFTGLNENNYRQKLGELFTKLHPDGDVPPMSLELTPLEHHHELHGFLIHSPFASGASGVVSAGFEKSTGQAVAIKRVKRTPATVARIQLEIQIYKKIGNHRNLCHLMADLYSGGDEYSTGKSKINDVYLVHSPLARQTFLDLTVSNRPYEVRISALHQVLKGLAHLHQHGIMHRDLKPTNMMIVSYSPVHAIIIDYGSATFDASSTDHYCGTIAYLAPEILKLKYQNKNLNPEPYDCRVDVWAMGLSGYQLFFQAPCRWEKGVSSAAHKDIIQNLRSRPASIADVLEKMLSWQPMHRPHANELLQSKVWPKLVDGAEAATTDISATSHVPKRAKR